MKVKGRNTPLPSGTLFTALCSAKYSSLRAINTGTGLPYVTPSSDPQNASPLVAITPKSLLRHPLAVSSLDELINGSFQNVIGELDNIDPKQVKRVVMCSGKVYYDLIEKRRENNQTDVAIIRIEQLYPFPLEEMQQILEPYAHVKDFVWCQEEPLNQGAWYCSKHNFEASLPEDAKLTYAADRLLLHGGGLSIVTRKTTKTTC
ncbi:2-oxoglutarate dehydrogenase E1 component [Mannheimia haemolytica]|uniref:2-oxoglutarate dehydrogenase E1 component n=1 Tax=Mannheimia haemolytica TaxID=75985 RepID=A0A378N1K7_MANHA|nr:2-oxoglutarate dehydrogenase E1 component [Mannheimia haemolytica]